MLDPAPAADAPSAAPSSQPTPQSPDAGASGRPDPSAFGARLERARAAVMAEAAEQGGEQTDDAPSDASSRDAGPTPPEDSSAASEAASEASAEDHGAETPEPPKNRDTRRFADLSRSEKAALLAEVRPLLAELEAENTQLKTSQQQQQVATQQAMSGFYSFFGMDDQGTDKPYLEIVARAEEGDWDAITTRKDLEARRRFGVSAIQRATEGAWQQLESAMGTARELAGDLASKAIASRDLGQVFKAIDQHARDEERARHKADTDKREQSYRTRLARALGQMPSPDGVGSPDTPLPAMSAILRGSTDDRRKWIERAKRGELKGMPLE